MSMLEALRSVTPAIFWLNSNHVLTQTHYDSIKQRMIRRQSKWTRNWQNWHPNRLQCAEPWNSRRIPETIDRQVWETSTAISQLAGEWSARRADGFFIPSETPQASSNKQWHGTAQPWDLSSYPRCQHLSQWGGLSSLDQCHPDGAKRGVGMWKNLLISWILTNRRIFLFQFTENSLHNLPFRIFPVN